MRALLRKTWRPALALSLALAATACARQPEIVVTPCDPPGFFLGLVQGFFIIFAFIGTFFDSDIAIYAVPNSGWPYNLGFIIGAALFFGMGGAGGASGPRKS